MIELQNVSKVLSGRTILDKVNLQIHDGETCVIVGPSGVGKSVTVKHMIRLLTPDSGKVIVNGDPISELSGVELETAREHFGVLFQGGALIEWLSVRENVALPLREKTSMGENDIIELAMQKLTLVGMADHSTKRPSELSGGMRKRVGLARATVRNPSILIYDEPTSGLDPVSARTIDDLILSMQAELGVTSVVVTHDLHSALSIGDRIAMITGGRFVETATPRQFVESENESVQAFLESQFITRQGNWEKWRR
jgi:phospholipid/cholesterol/gamma-HCH transport system ATP-binding protein